MRLFRFDPDAGREIGDYGSSGVTISRVVHLLEGATVNCAYLAANSVIGYHQAADSQLFLVLRGEGWVRGESPERTPIRTGQAAFWGKGEWHESATEPG